LIDGENSWFWGPG